MKKIAIILVLILLFVSTVPLMGCKDENEEPIMVQVEYHYVVEGPKNKSVTKIVIPEKYLGLPVTEIKADAFNSCASLSEVVIPDTVMIIGDRAFANCIALKEVCLPGVRTIGEKAFIACSNLETLMWSTDLKTVGAQAFDLCYKLPKYPS